jgi:hypothetical protein
MGKPKVSANYIIDLRELDRSIESIKLLGLIRSIKYKNIYK